APGFSDVIDLTGTVFAHIMGFALWIDDEQGVAWAQGTHEYRPMGVAAIASTDRFRPRDFRKSRRRPEYLKNAFVGFFGSLEEVNFALRSPLKSRRRTAPAHFI